VKTLCGVIVAVVDAREAVDLLVCKQVCFDFFTALRVDLEQDAGMHCVSERCEIQECREPAYESMFVCLDPVENGAYRDAGPAADGGQICPGVSTQVLQYSPVCLL
jgi:hypothetical protein